MLKKLTEWLFGKVDEHEHKFGLWIKKTHSYKRPPKSLDEFVRWGQIYERRFDEDYQERVCQECGYIEQEELEHGEN